MSDRYGAEEIEALKKVYRTIHDSPGLDFREVQARAKLGIKGTRACLNKLKDERIIREDGDDSSIRFFASGELSDKEQKLMGLLRQFVFRKIVLYLLEHPNSRPTDVAREVHTSNDTLSWHLGKLSELGVLEYKKSGWNTYVNISDSKTVMRLLIAYKESFLDRIVNSFVENWTER